MFDFGESAEFRAGKLQAINDLLPYTKPGSVEAAACIIRADGTRYDFKTGDVGQVAVNIPGEECAVLHSHTDDLPPSSRDFFEFLANPQVRDSFVVGESLLHRLHRPSDVAVANAKFSEDEVEERREQYVHDRAFLRLLDGGEVDSVSGWLAVELEAAALVAKDYGLKFVSEEHST